MNKLSFHTFFLLTLLTLNTAQAHTYWIEPNEFYFYNKSKEIDAKVSEVLTFEFTGSDTYFNADINRAKDEPNAYRFLITDSKGNHIPTLDSWSGKTRAVFEAMITEPGTYALDAARTGTPMYYTKLSTGTYINKPANKLSKEELALKEKSIGYYQFAKSYTTLHKPTNTWKQPLGHTLEIIPLSHPNTIYVGDTLKVKLLFNGSPLAGTKVKAISQNFRFKKHGQTPQSTVTDNDGIATINFTSANRYLLSAHHDVKLKNDKKAEGLNYKASLMLQVNEPWVRKWSRH
jgi:uncharacterized GH25 family protein